MVWVTPNASVVGDVDSGNVGWATPPQSRSPTGLLTSDDTFLLEKYYLQILAGITNNDIILDPEGHLSLSIPEVRIPFDVADTDIEISAVTLATLTGPLDVGLEAPNGELFGPGEAAADPLMEYGKSDDSILFRSSLPLVSGGEPLREGRWRVVLRLDVERFEKILRSIGNQYPDDHVRTRAAVAAIIKRIEELRTHGIKYSVVVQTYSNLRMDVALVQSANEPGAEVNISATLLEYGGPFRGSATCSADITDPNGTLTKAAMAHSGDGHYSANRLSTPGRSTIADIRAESDLGTSLEKRHRRRSCGNGNRQAWPDDDEWQLGPSDWPYSLMQPFYLYDRRCKIITDCS